MARKGAGRLPALKRLIIAFVSTLVVGLLVFFPARVAYHWFAPPIVALSGITGSVWRGSASQANIAGLYLGELRWRMRPLALLRGRASFDVGANPAGGVLDGNAAIGFNGDLHLAKTRASLPLDAIAGQLRVTGLRGTATADIERLQLSDGVPVAADGSAEVRGLVLPLVSPQPIGGYRVEFFTQEDGVVASVEDTDGFVDIAGRLLLTGDRSYEFIGQLAPKPETPPTVVEQMRFLGSPNARGQYELRLEGKL